jgi:DnaJ-class molecular chaperone
MKSRGLANNMHMRNLYETLGINKNANISDIKSGYRKKAKENHPDMGGDSIKFNEIHKAYSILRIPQKREAYDKTGQIDDSCSSIEDKIRSTILSIFVGIVGKVRDVTTIDIFEEMRKFIASKRYEIENAKEGLHDKLQTFEAVIKRIRIKNKKESVLFIIYIENIINSTKRDIEVKNEELKNNQKLLDFIKNYEYDVDRDLEEGYILWS